MIWSIAWKNVWRSRQRSLVVIIAVFLGIFGGLFGSAVMQGMAEQRLEAGIYNEVSHIQIHDSLFLDNQEVKYTIPEPDNTIETIENLPHVAAATRRSIMSAMVSTARTGTGVEVNGIHPEKEKQVTRIYTQLKDSLELLEEGMAPDSIPQYLTDSVGTYFGKDSRNPILISRRLAHKLGARVRSRLVIQLQGADGYLVGGQFRVVGIYETRNSAFDERNVFVRHSDLMQLTGYDENTTHEIAILLDDNQALDETMQRLKSELPLSLKVRDWKEIQPDLSLTSDMLDFMLYIIMIIILLALGFGIVNTMLMVILERVKELGMLMAVGMNRRRVFSMIMLETIFLSITGGIVGMIFSFFVIQYTGNTGLDLTQYAEGFAAIGYNPMVYPELRWDVYVVLTVLIILTGIIASVYPAIRALRMNPADAIRSE